MTEYIVFASILLSSIVHVLLGMLVLARFYRTGQLSNKKMAVASICGGLVAVVIYICPLSQLQMVYLEILLLMILAKVLLRIEMRNSLLVVMLYEIAIWLGVFIVSAASSVWWKSESFMNTAHLYGQLPIWIVHILCVIILTYVIKNEDIGAKEVFRITSVIAIIEMFAAVTISGMEISYIPTDTVYMWLIFSMVLLMNVLFLYILHQRRMEQEVVKLKQEQAELLEKDYKTLNQAYEINAKLFHDFHNHIGALQQMLAHEKYVEAADYLDALQEPVKEMTDTVWTGDDTVDYLINSKMTAASACGITFHVEVEFPRNTNIQGVDICAIIGNLIDNALDATKQNENQEDRKISLTIRRIHQMLVIKVENPYTVPVEQKETGELQTTKKQDGLHGWGLKSAQTAAEKYDGMVRTTCEDNIFRAVATLSYEGVYRE
ncbi:MAG: GHKL domain-containing protein [Lachnospiraceae bacterium]|nr:GHKL domain-containing protein [Lachnospiraceae bacterium]